MKLDYEVGSALNSSISNNFLSPSRRCQYSFQSTDCTKTFIIIPMSCLAYISFIVDFITKEKYVTAFVLLGQKLLPCSQRIYHHNE